MASAFWLVGPRGVLVAVILLFGVASAAFEHGPEPDDDRYDSCADDEALLNRFGKIDHNVGHYTPCP